MAAAEMAAVAVGLRAGLIADRMSGLNAFQRAYLETLMTLASWRVAQDCEMQVAHWAYRGRWRPMLTCSMRAHCTKKAHRAYTRRGRVTFASRRSWPCQAGMQAGSRAGVQAAAAYLGSR